MAEHRKPHLADDWEKDGTYTCQEYEGWKGLAQKNPIAGAILDSLVDSAVNSWETTGKNSEKLASILDGMEGNGKQNFRAIMKQMTWIKLVGRDSYAEIITDRNDDPEDLIVLPTSRITQVLKDGKIARYEDMTSGEKFRPQEILHFSHCVHGAETHGTSVIERIEQTLLSMNQLMDRGNKLYEMWSHPLIVAHVRSDDDADLEKVTKMIEKGTRTAQNAVAVPEDTVSKFERVGTPEGSGLDISKWYRIILNQVLMACRVSENILGIGTQNSEESARMQNAGFIQASRNIAKDNSEALRFQLFNQLFPKETPKIRFSFALETQEEKLGRYRQDIQTLFSWQATTPEDEKLRRLAILDRLIKMEVIQDE